MKRSNRWLFDAMGKQLMKAVNVRFSPISRTPEEVAEPDGTVTPLAGQRFGLCNIDVETLDEKDSYDFYQWLLDAHPRHDTLSVYLIDQYGVIQQTYEVDKVLPVGFVPGNMDRYQKNTFHSDTLRFVGNVRRISPS